MKPSEILRKAARRIERKHEDYSCCALRDAIFGARTSVDIWRARFNSHPAVRAYAVLLGRLPSISDFCKRSWDVSDDPDPRDWRVLALCLAAAIAESKGQ